MLNGMLYLLKTDDIWAEMDREAYKISRAEFEKYEVIIEINMVNGITCLLISNKKY